MTGACVTGACVTGACVTGGVGFLPVGCERCVLRIFRSGFLVCEAHLSCDLREWGVFQAN